MPGQPQVELCNAIDDDCDGRIDELNPQGGAACVTELLVNVSPANKSAIWAAGAFRQSLLLSCAMAKTKTAMAT